MDGKIGCCGFVPLLNYISRVHPVCLIRTDEDMNPIRDARGFCVECKRGEKGLLVGLINNNIPLMAYSGYANNSRASNSKVIDNLFRKGKWTFLEITATENKQGI